MRNIVAIAAVLAAPAAHAGTIIVGSCQAGTHLSTIQAAVTASGPNGVIKICPGTYPEQVTITKSLSLVGLTTGGEVLVTPPAGGVAVNTTYLGTTYPVAAQILAQGATVNISGLTVDGTGNGIAGCLPDLVGVLFQNASGTIKLNVVRNQFIAPYGSLGGCQSGQGIWAESSGTAVNVSITNNVVESFQKNAITANNTGVSFTITGNSLLGMGPVSGAAENGIQVSEGATGTVSKNRVGDEVWAPDQFGDTGDAAAGILVYDSPNVAISSNIVSSTQYGIAVVGDGNVSADGAQVTGNIVGRTYLYDAIDICGAGGATVTGNTLQSTDEAAVHLDSSCPSAASTGNKVTGNSVQGACAAVLVGTGSGGTTSPNTVISAENGVVTGSDVCPVATPSRVPASARRAVRAVRHAAAFGRR